jgi:hypothetical protein
MKTHVKKPDEIGEYHLIYIDILYLTYLYCGLSETDALNRALEIVRVDVQPFRDGLRREIVKHKGRHQHLTYHLLFDKADTPSYDEATLLRMIYQRLRVSGKFSMKNLWVEQNSPFLVIQKLFKIHRKLRQALFTELGYEGTYEAQLYEKILAMSIELWAKISAIDMRQMTIPQRLGLKRKLLLEVNKTHGVFEEQDVANDCYICEHVKGEHFEINCKQCPLFAEGETCDTMNDYNLWLSTGGKWRAFDVLYRLERIAKRESFRECKDALFVDALIQFNQRHNRDEFVYLNSFGETKCVRKYLESLGHPSTVHLLDETMFLHVKLKKRI